jgi:hypothetical protein
MESNTRAELNVELGKLRQQHFVAIYKATFGGFTREEEAAHEERVTRMGLWSKS